MEIPKLAGTPDWAGPIGDLETVSEFSHFLTGFTRTLEVQFEDSREFHGWAIELHNIFVKLHGFNDAAYWDNGEFMSETEIFFNAFEACVKAKLTDGTEYFEDIQRSPRPVLTLLTGNPHLVTLTFESQKSIIANEIMERLYALAKEDHAQNLGVPEPARPESEL